MFNSSSQHETDQDDRWSEIGFAATPSGLSPKSVCSGTETQAVQINRSKGGYKSLCIALRAPKFH